MITATEHLYITTDDQILGEPIVRGTRTSVRAIVELWRQGIAPDEIPEHLPHLSLAQVFDALSYYSDHISEINAHIERNRVPDDLIDPLVKRSLNHFFIEFILTRDSFEDGPRFRFRPASGFSRLCRLMCGRPPAFRSFL